MKKFPLFFTFSGSEEELAKELADENNRRTAIDLLLVRRKYLVVFATAIAATLLLSVLLRKMSFDNGALDGLIIILFAAYCVNTELKLLKVMDRLQRQSSSPTPTRAG